MKQSLYSILIFGCTFGKEGVPESIIELAGELGIKLETSYEAAPAFTGVRLATSSPCLAVEWSVPQLPLYFAVALNGFGSFVREYIDDEGLNGARLEWERLRALAQQRLDLSLPEGSLLYVHEFG